MKHAASAERKFPVDQPTVGKMVVTKSVRFVVELDLETILDEACDIPQHEAPNAMPVCVPKLLE